jgi:hypothetical protein
MWTYDLAREQAPTLDHLRTFFNVTRAGGYNAIGLYLEHRFAYPSTPWAHGTGCMTPEMIAVLLEEYPEIQIIPFVNLLGHMEGFLYTENGAKYAEERFKGLQADPTNADLVRLAEAIIDDTLAIFPSSIIHIGGDETWQLGAGAGSQARVKEYELAPGVDGKARLYGDHFGPLARRITDAGRRPAVWGDMFFDHPTALELIPRDTIIFDWQYFRSPSGTSYMFREKGYDVVYCPALHTYNATWLHLPQSEENVREHAMAAVRDQAFGVCVTTWECALFGNYETILPAIRACGKMLGTAGTNGEDSIPDPHVEPGIQPISIDPNPQLPDETELAFSIAVGISNSIIMSFLQAQATSCRIAREGELFIIEFQEPKRSQITGQLPIEQGEPTLNRLCLLAGMDPLRRQQKRTGTIRGTYKGARFEVAVQSEFQDGVLTLTMETTPLPNGATYANLRKAPNFLRAYLDEGETHEEFARLMGIELLDAGGPFTFTGIRSAMKCRMLLYSNPFLFWLRNRDEILGEPGQKAWQILDHAIAVSPDAAYRGCAEFAKLSIEFVRHTEDARRLYAAGLPGEANNALIVCRQIFENFIRIAKSTNVRIGGSLADIERCLTAREHIEKVIRRVKLYGDGSLGYLPSFETLCHPKFVPHDQANWWLINRWANE